MSLPFSNFPCSWIIFKNHCANKYKETHWMRLYWEGWQPIHEDRIFLTYYPIYITIVRPQFVYTLFIVRLRPNMSMRREVIINY